MEYWVEIDGEKQGPYREWDIREKIEKNTIYPTNLVWCNGMEGWEPIGEHSAFESAFQLTLTEIEEGEVSGNASNRPSESTDPSSANLYLVRRGVAKIFDLVLYSALSFILLSLCGVDLMAQQGWITLVSLIPFILLEALLIKLKGGSIGKMIVGIRVTSSDHSDLTMKKACVRSGLSWIYGMALGLPLLLIIAAGISYYRAKKNGIVSWDEAASTKVEMIKPFTGMRISLLFITLLSIAGGLSQFIQNHAPTRKAYSEYSKALIEQAPELKRFITELEAPSQENQ